jgi:stage II sporulation protein AA (anti-sigma F factor antagonist)
MTTAREKPTTTGQALSITTFVAVAEAAGADAEPPAVGPSSAAVVLVGRLDAVEAPAVRAELDRVLRAGGSRLVVDLVAVTFVDSAGLAALVRARRDARQLGGDIVLISPSDRDALRVFGLTQFDEVFRMVDSRAAA